MDCAGGRAEAVEEVPERREETFFIGWFSGVGKRVIRSAEAGACVKYNKNKGVDYESI